ncbi:MAG TPA: energy-coupling factor transporter transmembrane component T [Nocardioidaceae bacterium]|nr:energy-coupling factor transporter transmembrane component T [Nocardioidaceae bacterium]
MRSGPGPLSVLAACLVPVAGALAVNSTATGFTVLGAQVLLLGGLARDLRSTAARLALGSVAAVSVMVSTWLYGGQNGDEAVAAALRVLSIVTPSALLSPRIVPTELGDHLAQRLHLPARVVVAGVAALQRLDSITESWQQVQRARRARGLGIDGGVRRRLRASAHSAFALLVISMRSTGQLSTAMDVRGFTSAQARTWAGPAPWRLADSVLLAVAAALAVVPWFVR